MTSPFSLNVGPCAGRRIGYATIWLMKAEFISCALKRLVFSTTCWSLLREFLLLVTIQTTPGAPPSRVAIVFDSAPL